MSKTAKTSVCIVCPLGCRVNSIKKGEEFVLEGYQCSKGAEYVLQELTNPVRVLTTTVSLNRDRSQRLAVRTTGPIPKDYIFQAMKIIKNIEVKSPVQRGQVVISNLLNTGVDVIASA